jgi:hypothetical protein
VYPSNRCIPIPLINKVGGDRHVPTPSLYLHAFKTNLEGLGMFLPFPSTFHDFKDT